jgi:hypothetical protein
MDDVTPYRDTTTAVARTGFSLRTLLIAGAIMLVGGGVAGSWLVWRYTQSRVAAAPITIAGAAQATPAQMPSRTSTLPVAATAPAAPLTATQEATLATRISLLEDRLARISSSADGASGNAAKAEALLLALAARRTLDRGLPLGVLEAQLRLRFGETQPVAVNAIIAAGRSPMTEDELTAQLAALRGQLDMAPDASILDRIRGGIDSLIVIRPNDAPSPNPANRYERAQQALERGRIDLAIAEIEAMPGAAAPTVAAWLSRARRRNDAARALDLIESAAILEPGAMRGEAGQ